MSYDIQFGVKVADVTPECFAVIGAPEYDSPTYNLRDIFVKSMDWDYHQGEWYPVTEVLPKVQRGITELTLHPTKYKALEPDNGWGSVGGAVCFLQSVMDYFKPDEWGGLYGSWNANVPLEAIYMRW